MILPSLYCHTHVMHSVHSKLRDESLENKQERDGISFDRTHGKPGNTHRKNNWIQCDRWYSRHVFCWLTVGHVNVQLQLIGRHRQPWLVNQFTIQISTYTFFNWMQISVCAIKAGSLLYHYAHHRQFYGLKNVLESMLVTPKCKEKRWTKLSVVSIWRGTNNVRWQLRD